MSSRHTTDEVITAEPFDEPSADAWFDPGQAESWVRMLLELNEYRPTILAAGMPGKPEEAEGDAPEDEEEDEEESSPT